MTVDEVSGGRVMINSNSSSSGSSGGEGVDSATGAPLAADSQALGPGPASAAAPPAPPVKKKHRGSHGSKKERTAAVRAMVTAIFANVTAAAQVSEQRL